jgi:hypothetical protein
MNVKIISANARYRSITMHVCSQDTLDWYDCESHHDGIYKDEDVSQSTRNIQHVYVQLQLILQAIAG